MSKLPILPFNKNGIAQFSPAAKHRFGEMATILEGTTKEDVVKLNIFGDSYVALTFMKLILQENKIFSRRVLHKLHRYYNIVKAVENEITDSAIQFHLIQRNRKSFALEMYISVPFRFHQYLISTFQLRTKKILRKTYL